MIDAAPWAEPAGPRKLAPIETGTAGASSRLEFERRQAKRVERVEQRWGTGRIGRVAQRLSDDPASTTAWKKGAAGEVRVAEILHELLGDRAVLLHDRKVPKTRGNIDHLVIAPSGVWVIDAKQYQGKVERRNVGVFFFADYRLFVGGRDRTKVVAGLGWQLDAVRTALDGDTVPVHAALSFVGAEWSRFFAKPFQLNDVWISWPAKLAELISAGQVLTIDDIECVATLLAHKLPAK